VISRALNLNGAGFPKEVPLSVAFGELDDGDRKKSPPA
jgi:hypothetical protein